MKLRLIVTTLDDEAKAETLARALVEARLAACAQIFPVRSIYRWKGAPEEAAEWRVEFKTRAALHERAVARLRALHPYETPEILGLDIADADPAYAQWVFDSTTDESATPR